MVHSVLSTCRIGRFVLKITIEYNRGWWDWTVEGDDNARAPYCGTAIGLSLAYDGCLQAIQYKARNPYKFNVRTEY